MGMIVGMSREEDVKTNLKFERKNTQLLEIKKLLEDLSYQVKQLRKDVKNLHYAKQSTLPLHEIQFKRGK